MRWIPVARVFESAFALYAPSIGRSEAVRVVYPGDTNKIGVLNHAAVIDDARGHRFVLRNRLGQAAVAGEAAALSSAI